jgi:hypothetical protein
MGIVLMKPAASIGRAVCRCCGGRGSRMTPSGRHVACTGCDGRGYFRLGATEADTAKLGYDDYVKFAALAFTGRRISPVERSAPMRLNAVRRAA